MAIPKTAAVTGNPEVMAKVIRGSSYYFHIIDLSARLLIIATLQHSAKYHSHRLTRSVGSVFWLRGTIR